MWCIFQRFGGPGLQNEILAAPFGREWGSFLGSRASLWLLWMPLEIQSEKKQHLFVTLGAVLMIMVTRERPGDANQLQNTAQRSATDVQKAKKI